MSCFFDRFLRYAESNPSAIALQRLENGTTATYGELLAKVKNIAEMLHSSGVRRGDRIVVIVSATEAFACTVLACFGVGAIAIPLNSTVTTFELEQFLSIAEPVGIVSTAAIIRAQSSCLLEPRGLKFVLALDRPAHVPDVRSSLMFLSLDNSVTSSFSLSSPSPESILTCHFTYKGTGVPLPVEHRAESYEAVILQFARLVNDKPGERALIALPVYPIFGIFACVLVPLSMGHCLVLADKSARVDLAETLLEQNISYAPTVPDLLVHMNRKIRKSGKSFVGSFRKDLVLFCGASHLPDTVAQETFELLGVEPLQGYGTTEVLPCLSNLPGQAVRGTLGVLIDGDELRVEDAFGHELGIGQTGELLIRGISVAHGFAGLPRESAVYFRDGWFKTGDLVYKTNSGSVVYVGRKLPFTKVGSQMVDILELENVAARHPSVARAKVFVETDENGMAAMVLHVIRKRRGTVNERELYNFCRGHLSPHKVPKRFRFYSTQRVSDES